ncbi:hypothetical protein ABFA07_013611 [Porites harrisoni]
MLCISSEHPIPNLRQRNVLSSFCFALERACLAYPMQKMRNGNVSTSMALHIVKYSSNNLKIGLFTVIRTVIPSFRMQISSHSLRLHARQVVAIVLRLTQEDEPIINTDGVNLYRITLTM